MTEVLSELADSIRLEPPGSEGEGAEFWLRKAGVLEYHQVKSQRADSGWNLAQLEAKRVLSNFYRKLSSDPEARCVFVSTDRAYELQELAGRARGAASAQEFQADFLTSGTKNPWLTAFDNLRGYWGDCSPEAAYVTLRNVFVHAVDEEMLDSIVTSALETLVEGDPSLVYASLAQFALDNVHQELIALDIWNHLEREGFSRRAWGNDPRVLSAVGRLNDTYTEGLRSTAIGQELIPRSETAAVLQVLVDTARAWQAGGTGEIEDIAQAGKRAVLLVGQAGVGKSGVILGVTDALRNTGTPFIALRIDKLTPSHLPEQVGQALGLPGSPANVLASVAHNRQCVLVIDQLDAVSLASGRNPEFFDCIYGIIKEALAHPNMLLLLACRKFDLDNDSRLRRLTGEGGVASSITVSTLDHVIVRNVVTAAGLNAGSLTLRQLDLLSIPLHLRLLVEVAQDRSADALDFKTAKDLYDNFWNHKRQTLQARGRGEHWTDVIDTLCAYMSEAQVLFAPKELVDQYAPDAEAMASEHVLTHDGVRYAFFHEGFFDYAFARRFVTKNMSLVELLHAREQHLFRRAQVRQVLLYLRDADRERYADELRALLTDPGIRFHIKTVVFGLLRGLADPSWQEWEVLRDLMSGSDQPLEVAAWNTLLHTVPWFDLLSEHGVVQGWLRLTDDTILDRTAILLSTIQRERGDEVALLIEPYAGGALQSERWRNRYMYIMQQAEYGKSRHFLDLFLRLIDSGVLDDIRGPIAVNADFWLLIYSLPDTHSDWASEVIGHYLERRIQLSREAGDPDVFSQNAALWAHAGHGNDDVIARCSRGAPSAFVRHVLPPILRIMELTVSTEGQPPFMDGAWSHRAYGPPYDTRSALLSGMVGALSQLADSDPAALAQAVQQLRESPYLTATYLIVRAYTFAGQAAADEAAEYLCDLPDRLRAGYGQSGDAAFWSARQLVEAISPHCSVANLARLEDTILGYYPDIERTWVRTPAWDYPLFGRAQFVLLGAIDPARRSWEVTTRLKELQRKFASPDRQLRPPEPDHMQFISSRAPILAERADKVSDEQWLGAMAKYTGQFHGRMGGSATELSSVLQERVSQEPERFAHLLLRFPDNTDFRYFGAVLMGLAQANYNVEALTRLCEYCYNLPGRPCGYYIVRAISSMAATPLPDEALQLVAWHVVEGQDYIRGLAAQAMEQLLQADGGRIQYFLPTLRRLTSNEPRLPRYSIMSILTAILGHDRDLAVSLFVELGQNVLVQALPRSPTEAAAVLAPGKGGDEEAAIGSSFAEYFLLTTVVTHIAELAPALELLVVSPTTWIARAGTLAVCKAAVVHEEAQPLATRCADGSEVQQLAIAEVTAANVRFKGAGDFSSRTLLRLFDSEYETVRSKAATCFNHMEESRGESMRDHEDLIAAFIGSRAFIDGLSYLVHALGRTTSRLPETTYQVCERFLDVVGPATADIQTKAAADARSVIQLIVSLYGRAMEERDAGLASDCLSLLDRAASFGTLWLDETLSIYER